MAFMNSASNFENFENKDKSDSLIISEIIDSRRDGYLNV